MLEIVTVPLSAGRPPPKEVLLTIAVTGVNGLATAKNGRLPTLPDVEITVIVVRAAPVELVSAAVMANPGPATRATTVPPTNCAPPTVPVTKLPGLAAVARTNPLVWTLKLPLVKFFVAPTVGAKGGTMAENVPAICVLVAVVMVIVPAAPLKGVRKLFELA